MVKIAQSGKGSGDFHFLLCTYLKFLLFYNKVLQNSKVIF